MSRKRCPPDPPSFFGAIHGAAGMGLWANVQQHVQQAQQELQLAQHNQQVQQQQAAPQQQAQAAQAAQAAQ